MKILGSFYINSNLPGGLKNHILSQIKNSIAIFELSRSEDKCKLFHMNITICSHMDEKLYT